MDEIQVYDGDGTTSNVPIFRQSGVPTPPASLLALTGDPMYPQTTPLGRPVQYPFPNPRPGQLEAIDTVADILGSGAHALLCAGTGFGKSPVLVGAASLFQNAWLIVGRNDLVEQWRSDYARFAGVGFMKARHLYGCPVLAGQVDEQMRPFSCDTGKAKCGTITRDLGELCSSTVEDCRQAFPDGHPAHPVLVNNPRCKALLGPQVKQGLYDAGAVKNAAHEFMAQHECPYIANRDHALAMPYTVMTASMALTIFTYMKGHPLVKPRELLVVDECSELENELLKFYEVTLRSRWVANLFGVRAELGKILPETDPIFQAVPKDMTVGDFLDKTKPTDLQKALYWLQIMDRMADAKLQKLSDDATKDRDEIENFRQRLNATRIGVSLKVPYHFKCEESGKDYTVNIVPLEARGLFDQTLGTMAKHCIFTSATTGTATLFRDTHSMKSHVIYAEGGTPFPPSNRPIFFHPLGNLTKQRFDMDIQKLAEGVVKIASQQQPGGAYDHQNQKGLIHTYTNKVLDHVRAAFERAGQGRRLVVLQGGGQQRNAIVQHFKASPEPLILISPSAMLGLSLDDDLGRWQVVCKMPYSYLGDPSVEHRKDSIDGWYSWQTTKDLIQAFGRIVRSPNDWGITYVVDEAFRNHMKFNRQQFPNYILNALHGV